MNALINALRRAVQAEIAAAAAAAGRDSEGRRLISLAERMEVERSWALVAKVASELRQEREEA
jgi:hypothetical protein